jgi:DNA-directed RNA polymerase specialized sigma24 family protein
MKPAMSLALMGMTLWQLHAQNKLDRLQRQIIELRYSGGLSIEDTSQSLGIPPVTAKRGRSSACAWLLREMGRGEARA